MNLLNNVFDLDQVEIIKTNSSYIKIFVILFLLLLILFLIIKKDYYYENSYLKDGDKVILLADSKMINDIKKRDYLIINNIEYKYSINSVFNNGDFMYLDIKLDTSILDSEKKKYKIFIRKETFLEYIIRVIKKDE